MKEIVQYCADDGKVFGSREDCEIYEKQMDMNSTILFLVRQKKKEKDNKLESDLKQLDAMLEKCQDMCKLVGSIIEIDETFFGMNQRYVFKKENPYKLAMHIAWEQPPCIVISQYYPDSSKSYHINVSENKISVFGSASSIADFMAKDRPLFEDFIKNAIQNYEIQHFLDNVQNGINQILEQEK